MEHGETFPVADGADIIGDPSEIVVAGMYKWCKIGGTRATDGIVMSWNGVSEKAFNISALFSISIHRR